MNLKNIIFSNLIFYYLLILSIKYNICNDSNFFVNGTIILYNKTILESVGFSYNTSMVNSTNSDNQKKLKTFYFSSNLDSLDYKITFSAKSSDTNGRSRIEASFNGEVINSKKEFCCHLEKESSIISINNNKILNQSVKIDNSIMYYELPDNSTNKDYEIQFVYHIEKKYSCKDHRIVIKPNITSNFTISSLINNNGNIKNVCCSEVNISFSFASEGYSMINYTTFPNTTFPNNTVFYNPINFTENNNIINFKNDKIGCYDLIYNISQENYLKGVVSCKKSYVICYKGCEDCYCGGNETNHKCKECTENHYKKAGDKYKDNCYTEDEKI